MHETTRQALIALADRLTTNAQAQDVWAGELLAIVAADDKIDAPAPAATTEPETPPTE